MNILVTGGLGYIGSHVVLELIKNGYKVDILDNLSNSDITVHQKLEKFSKTKIRLHVVDLRSKLNTLKVFSKNNFIAVMHFAGLKAVGESVLHPEIYYDNNVFGTINLVNAMRENDCHKIIFSSSATVYGKPNQLPIKESASLHSTSPYGENKLTIERYLNFLSNSDKRWCFAALRYFNPAGGHPSYLFGENPASVPNNLMPLICQVGAKKIEKLQVFGDDFNTSDGTGVRDYIHVVDLALGHIAALDYIIRESKSITVNLGTGKGYSVLEMIKTFEKVNKVRIPFEYGPRRDGDIDCCYANTQLAEKILSWKAKFGLHDMCRDSWESQKNLK